MIDRLFARACRARVHLLLIAGTALCPTMLRAQAPVETLIGRVGATDAQGMAAIELRFLNMGAAPATMPLPDRVEALVEQDGAARRLWLRRAPGRANPSSSHSL